MNQEEITTKDKILQVAHKLFSEKGFSAVGVREIAKVADVNVAAINYHFGNKDNLYAETVSASLNKTLNDISEIYNELGDKASTENLSLGIYNYFVSHKDDLLTGFKLFFSAGPDNSNDVIRQHDEVGPPGGIFLFQTLKSEVPNASDKDIIWAVRTIFTHLLHKAMLICNHCDAINTKYGLGPEDFKADILRLVRIVVKEVKQSS